MKLYNQHTFLELIKPTQYILYFLLLPKKLGKQKTMHAHHEWVIGHARASHGLPKGRHGRLVLTVDWESRAYEWYRKRDLKSALASNV